MNFEESKCVWVEGGGEEGDGRVPNGKNVFAYFFVLMLYIEFQFLAQMVL